MVCLRLHDLHVLWDCSLEADDTLRDEAKQNVKRHSEGTFSNDYSKYLEDRKAQDFVQWLMNNKRSGSVWERRVFFNVCDAHSDASGPEPVI